MRLEKYIDVRPTAAMTDIIVNIMVEVISILGIATKEIEEGRFSMPFLVDISPKFDVSRREIRQEAVWNTSS
jgi:hypothetical protein